MDLSQKIAYPALFNAAEKASSDSQRSFLIARAAEFALLIISAGFGEIPRDSLSDSGSWVAVIAFLLALLIRLSGVAEGAEKRWYDARAAAESIKSSAWQYAVCGAAFPLSDNRADVRFREGLKRILEVLPNLNIPAGSGNHLTVTDEMREIRNSILADRSKYYLKDRVQEQQSWYSAKADFNRKRSRQWSTLLIAVDISAILLGIFRILGLFDVNWLGVLATAAAGIAAWQQTKNYSSLTEAYSVTSQEVAIVGDTIEQPNDDESAWADVVHDAEAAFSREHTLWLSRRAGRPRTI